MLRTALPASSGSPEPKVPQASRVTRVTVERPARFGAPVRVRTSDGLLAVRLVARDGAHAEVALLASGAMLLGGDHVVVIVRVDPGCALTLTDVGGTVAYDGDGEGCRWDADIHLGPGAGLAWAGLPFVVAAGADVRRTTTARLGAGAHLSLRETVVLGRSGERGGRIVVRTDVVDDVGPILVEELSVAGEHPVPGVLGGHSVLDTVTDVRGCPDDGVVDPTGPAPERTPAPDPGDAVTLRLERGGTLTRWLGPATHLSPLEPPALAAPAPTNPSEVA
ncbi:urease accessory protein UreD [Antribacter sp. KLBMP9083]|uniref:Urease accessory protein UreD n=1 Tax=Antribacter soli TaxID=2910976 RepID=A0AA41QFC6_9MICO|nr:urease accessory protein UreD [Antribacter soli]MCF4121137.1 urease accessory protein UreD [Antribacter soli]